jgi:predicted alpha/beta-hydrolase family hydrolase
MPMPNTQPATPTLLLGPGASHGVEQLEPLIASLRAGGVSAEAVPLPRGSAERALPVYRAALTGRDPAGTVLGGHSFGGRVASLLAADETPPSPAGLVLLSYPLHAPGRHEAWDERTAHWPRIARPVLLLSGDRDMFARVDLLRTAVERLPDAELVILPGIGHGVWPALDDAVERIIRFVRRLGR